MITQRAHEIGVRMALGATRYDVLRLTVGQTGRLAATGVGLGIGLALALSRVIEAGLLGVAPHDLRIVAASPPCSSPLPLPRDTYRLIARQHSTQSWRYGRTDFVLTADS